MVNFYNMIRRGASWIRRRILVILLTIKYVVVEGHSFKYALRCAFERTIFSSNTYVHELPEIFHYWSNTHLAPGKFHQFGIESPDHFFYIYVKKMCDEFPDKQIRICSLGAGNCDLEVELASQLRDNGCNNFLVECLEINDHMLARGNQLATEHGQQQYVRTSKCDLNSWQADKKYDVVMANQCLHHVMKLESLFNSVHEGLASHGYFLTSDVIGRNGHQCWPEAMSALQPFWQELPDAYRFNQLQNRMETEYINYDCAKRNFEGIRAQDILPLLIEKFHFELFIPFASIITIFIDRPFGHNFDARGEWDRDFIDRVHARDEAGILSGELKPTQMLAVLRNVPTETQLLAPSLTPEFCVRAPG